MKKSKIIGLALGLTALTATAIATTTVLTSCSKDKVSNEQLKEGFVKFEMQEGKGIPTDAKVIREKGTNNYIVYTGVTQDNKPAVSIDEIVYMGPLTEGFTQDQIKKLGLGETNSYLQPNLDWEEKGNEFNNLQKGKSMILCNELWAVELSDQEPSNQDEQPTIKKSVQIAFNLKIIFDSYKA